jgi:hypothetical protein
LIMHAALPFQFPFNDHFIWKRACVFAHISLNIYRREK